jgi:hypothetical protein
MGTKQVTDKNGKTRTEPIYEYGRNKPTVIDEGAVAVRLEVRRRCAGAGRRNGASSPINDNRLAEEGARPDDGSRRDDAGSRSRNGPPDW